jgi:hypothetical protein
MRPKASPAREAPQHPPSSDASLAAAMVPEAWVGRWVGWWQFGPDDSQLLDGGFRLQAKLHALEEFLRAVVATHDVHCQAHEAKCADP